MLKKLHVGEVGGPKTLYRPSLGTTIRFGVLFVASPLWGRPANEVSREGVFFLKPPLPALPHKGGGK